MTKPTNDVIIIGAGAAGLMAAASAGSRGLRVLVLEKNRKIGVKILMSGGTRCNITHNCDSRGIVEAYGRQGRFLHSALAALPPEEVIRLMHRLDVPTKAEETGKIFPVSNSAVDVRDALVRHAEKNNAEILNLNPVTAIAEENGIFHVTTVGGNRFSAAALVITTGGKSYPGCGTTGDGYAWAEQFGHSIVKTVPALTPVTCNEPWANGLKGITIPDTEIAVWDRSTLTGEPDPRPASDPPKKKKKRREPLDARRGSFLFTHFGFSGPAALNVSREITRRESPAGLMFQLDFLPSMTEQQLSAEMKSNCAANGKQIVGNQLTSLLPARLVDVLVTNSGIDARTRNAELSSANISRMVEAIKQTRLPVSGTLGFKKAEVTAGGVNLKEINGGTMESRMREGLFFAGEILDLDGPIGGYNFQSAFSTGWLAGQHVCRSTA